MVRLFLLWFCLFVPMVAGSQPLIRPITDAPVNVSPGSVSVYIDHSADLPFSQVLKQSFTPAVGPTLSFASSKTAVWLRFRVATGTPDRETPDRETSAQVGPWLLESSNYLIEDVQFYGVSARTGRVHTSQQGTFFLDSPRDVQTNLAYFRLFPADTVTCYLRVQNYMPLTVSLRLLTMQQLTEENHRKDLFQGLLFGILVAMGLYNLVLLLTIRDRVYLYYVLYVALTLIVTDTEGYINEFVFARIFPGYSRNASIPFSLSLLFALLFARQFLNTARHSPRLDRFLIILLFGCLIPPLGVLLNKPLLVTHGMEIMIVSTALSLWGTGIYLFSRGLREARYYVLAWSMLWLGVLVFVGQLNGWLPRNLLTLNAVRVGTALETMLLSFALADRINVLRRERALAQAQLIETVRESEETKTRLAESESKLLEIQMKPASRADPVNKIALPTFEGLLFVKVADIIRCESDRNYTRFFVADMPPFLVSKNLGEFDAMLTDYNFFRVHNSHLINLSHVRRYVRGEGGQVEMSDGGMVDVSRRRKDELLARLVG